MVHDGSYRVFSLGMPATPGLEVLAEGGDNSMLLAEADTAGAFRTETVGGGVVPPGEQVELTLQFNDATVAQLNMSLVSMLVNTNDAFTAANSLDLTGLAAGESLVRRVIAYDAGTEADTEGAGTIPGPAVGGEGFNADRDDDADRVSMHAGVISAMDGLLDSVLDEQHRFDNPVARIVITRLN